MQSIQKYMRLFTLVGFITGLFALVSQMWLMIERLDDYGVSLISQIVKFFSFMTILTNIIVMLTFGVVSFPGNSKLYNFISRVKVQSAIAVYIFIVALIYHLFLAQIWSPTGMQYVTDQLLHTYIPLLYIVYWFLFVKKGELTYGYAFQWLIYPLVYVIYVMIRGAISGNYPYPFLEVGKLGYPSVLLNIALIGVAYSIVGFVFISLDKLFGRKL